MRTNICRMLLLAGWLAVAAAQVDAEIINELLVGRASTSPPSTTVLLEDGRSYRVDPTLPGTEVAVNADYLARAAVYGDDTRLAEFAGDVFIPSAIPVAGQPFFGSGTRANLQASGSAVRLNAYAPLTAGVDASAHAQFMLENAQFSAGDSSTDAGLSIRQVYGRINRLTVGVLDSVFSDPSAVPETIDLAGPNARITVFNKGVGSGQGQLSYDLLSDEPDGFEIIASVEQSIPEITTPVDGDETFAELPDFVCATQYVVGETVCSKFTETWHVQAATVFRDLGVENEGGPSQTAFGWGSALSGAYRFALDPQLNSLDRVMFSVAYGEGISHYIADLNAADDTGDAVITTTGALDALNVFAWYAAYTHNWNDFLRSTATYSQVTLDSVLPMGATASPYRNGDFVAVNLIYHNSFLTPGRPDPNDHVFYTGVEYLFGAKETLDGSEGDAQRVMFVVAISK